jgi:protein TonB
MMPLTYALALIQLASPTPDTPINAMPLGNPGDWFPQDAYPKEARKENAQGNISVRLEIGATGRTIGCTVTESSGFSSLDEPTCRLAIKNARYKPVIVNGVAIPSHSLIRNILWRKP